MADNPKELYKLAYCYYTGTHGYPLNYTKALEYFNKAAQAGVSDAMNYLGLIYEKGEIVTRDYRIAVDWFYRAIKADTGNAHAAYNLGRMYYSGYGVEKNLPKAYEFCKATVDLGLGNTHSAYPMSCYYTGCILLEHYKNKKEAYPYFVEAAKYGKIPGAWYNLGYLTEQGLLPSGASQDSKTGTAISFYEKAAELGYVPAMDAVGRLYASVNMMNEARPWLEKAASMGNEAAKKRLKLLKASQSGSVFDLFI